MKSVGLKIEYGKELKKGTDRGEYRTIGDPEHLEIMKLYAEGLSYNKLSEQLNRPTKSLSDHIHKHNSAVKRSGFCPICRRAGGEFSGQVVKRGIAKKE